MDNEKLKVFIESLSFQNQILAKLRMILRIFALSVFAIVFSIIVTMLISVSNYMDVILNTANYYFYIGTLVLLSLSKLCLIFALIVLSTTCFGVLHIINLIRK